MRYWGKVGTKWLRVVVEDGALHNAFFDRGVQPMKVEYDPTTDSMYISLKDVPSVESEEVSEGVVLDFDAAGKVVGIDIQHASTRADVNQWIFERVA